MDDEELFLANKRILKFGFLTGLVFWALLIIYILKLEKSLPVSVLFIILSAIVIYVVFTFAVLIVGLMSKGPAMVISMVLLSVTIVLFINQKWIFSLMLIDIWFLVGYVGAIFHSHHKE